MGDYSRRIFLPLMLTRMCGREIATVFHRGTANEVLRD
jgi:hypothetical protein